MMSELPDPLLLIDGECSLCNASVRLILRLEARPVIYFAALDSEKGRKLLRNLSADTALPDSVILIDSGGLHVKSRALARIGKHAGGWLAPLRLLNLFPRSWADGMYDFVARRRIRWFGRTSYCAQVKASQRHRFIDL
ncbi:MAG: DUF393 domain-containing protein [Bacteroidetes bacterium]|nr:DUF393 domain-containing protein [Bacteroidota bacterium]